MLLHALYALSCALVWAGTNITGKMLPGDIPALTFAFMRYVIAIACLAPFVPMTEYKKITRSMVPSIMFLGLSVVVLYNALYFNALHLAPVTTVSLISVTNPIMTLLITSLLARRIPAKHHLIAFVLAFVGAVLLITQGKTGLEVFAASKGELLALASVVVYVAYTLMLRSISKNFSPFFLSFATGVTGLIFLLPFVANQDSYNALAGLSIKDWLLFAYLGSMGTGLGLVLYVLSIRRRGAEMTSLITFSALPLFACVLSYFILGEPLNGWQLGGGVLVLAALFIGVREKK